MCSRTVEHVTFAGLFYRRKKWKKGDGVDGRVDDPQDTSKRGPSLMNRTIWMIASNTGEAAVAEEKG